LWPIRRFADSPIRRTCERAASFTLGHERETGFTFVASNPPVLKSR
jgi:hypothetical protein